MERKRVPVDWDELEMALTWHGGEWHYYLDLRTGHVVQSEMRFGGELDEEEDEISEEGDEFPEERGPISERRAEAGLDEGRLIPIDPLESSVEYGWMEEFAEAVTEPRLLRRLEASLGGRGAFRRFKDSLIDYPEERARWFAFRDERMRMAVREWLADNASSRRRSRRSGRGEIREAPVSAFERRRWDGSRCPPPDYLARAVRVGGG